MKEERRRKGYNEKGEKREGGGEGGGEMRKTMIAKKGRVNRRISEGEDI
jgi:hypothetical protein